MDHTAKNRILLQIDRAVRLHYPSVHWRCCPSTQSGRGTCSRPHQWWGRGNGRSLFQQTPHPPAQWLAGLKVLAQAYWGVDPKVGGGSQW